MVFPSAGLSPISTEIMTHSTTSTARLALQLLEESTKSTQPSDRLTRLQTVCEEPQPACLSSRRNRDEKWMEDVYVRAIFATQLTSQAFSSNSVPVRIWNPPTKVHSSKLRSLPPVPFRPVAPLNPRASLAPPYPPSTAPAAEPRPPAAAGALDHTAPSAARSSAVAEAPGRNKTDSLGRKVSSVGIWRISFLARTCQNHSPVAVAMCHSF